MQFRQDMAKKQYTEQTGREQALEREVQELKDKVQGQYDDIVMLERNVKYLRDENERLKREKEASSAPCGCQAYRNLEEQTGREQDLEREVADLKERLKMETAALERLRKDTPTMPVIPKDVAIAIFREGMAFGAEAACSEIEGEEIIVSETGYTGDFEVSFERRLQLDDHIEFDWVRSKVGNYDEDNVTAALEGLCAEKEFECRIHGVDDNKTTK